MELERLTKLVMKLFSLKGRTNYSKLDVIAWTDVLKRYSEKEINDAFGKAIRDPGFLDITKVLEILDPPEPKESMAIITWERLVELAKSGGTVPAEERAGAPFKILNRLGGMLKLRFTSNEFVLSQMKKNYIQIYCEREGIEKYARKKLPEGLAKSIGGLIGGKREQHRIENK